MGQGSSSQRPGPGYCQSVCLLATPVVCLRIYKSVLSRLSACLDAQVLGEEPPLAAGMAASLSSGSVTLVSGAAQWQGVMDGVPPTTLLVAMFGLSSDSVCTAAAEAMQELAAVYRSAVFVRIN